MSIPVVAIVGRPNVGKSTLFNRVLRRRLAIVDDLPGVTRDRNYARAEWGGRTFYLVDTGGLVPHSRNRMEAAIKAQVTAALQECDLVILVVDAKQGITAVDRHIAQWLRKSGRPVILAANKADNTKDEAEIYQFYGLGLGEPQPVSAASGRNSGDLLDSVVAKLPPAEPEAEPDSGIRVALLGKPNVGKSSLLNAIAGVERVIVDAEPGTTRDAVDTLFYWQGHHMVLVDTAGLRRKSKAEDQLEFYTRLRTERAVQQSQVGVLVIDASQGLSHLDMTLAGMLEASDRAAVVAVNKWDLVAKGNQANFVGWLRKEMPFFQYATPVFTSALQREGIEHLLQEIVSARSQWRHRVDPELLAAAFERTVERYQPPSPKGKEIALYAISQSGIEPPSFVISTNQPKLVPESYRRYLAAGLRDALGIRGTPLRFEYRLSRPPAAWQSKRLVAYGQRPKTYRSRAHR